MAAAERCDFSELPKDQCAHCVAGTRTLPDVLVPGTEADEAPPFRPRSGNAYAGPGPWISAQFATGSCPECRRPHRVADRIRADGEGGWLCEDCG